MQLLWETPKKSLGPFVSISIYRSAYIPVMPLGLALDLRGFVGVFKLFMIAAVSCFNAFEVVAL